MNELPSPRAGSARNDVIVAFYSGEKPDSRGRYIEEVWSFSDHQLENVHDYIQWLFPLPTRSAFNPTAPLLTQRTISAFRESELLSSRLRQSIEVMLKFYGLESVQAKHGVGDRQIDRLRYQVTELAPARESQPSSFNSHHDKRQATWLERLFAGRPPPRNNARVPR